ncbi:hypothetical protein N9B94_03225 [Verrucomicrobia bacterium]|nr:hypothetical protein [Verrucomicrobiota bacterium]
MSEPSNKEDDLTRLISRLCDGCITDKEMGLISERLASDLGARKAYRRYMDLEMELRLTPFATELVNGAEDGVVPFESSPVKSRVFQFAAIAAALALGLVLLTQSISNRFLDSERVVVAPVVYETPFEAVAGIVTMENATWSSAGAPVGNEFASGHHELIAGTATILFLAGSSVSLEGPVSFDTRGTNSFYLHQGIATVFVPAWNTDFQIAAPRLELIEPGIECGICVDMHGAATLGVFRGEAVARIDSEFLGMPQDVRLTRKEGVEIDEAGAITTAIIGNNSRFKNLRQTPGQEVPMIANGSFEFPRVRGDEEATASGWTLLAHPLANVDRMPVDAGVVNRELSGANTPDAPSGRQWAYLNAATFIDGRSTFTTMHQAVGLVRAGTNYRLSFFVGTLKNALNLGGFEAGLYAGSIEEGPLSAMKVWKNPVPLKVGRGDKIILEYECPRSTPYRDDQLFIVFGSIPSANAGIHKVLIDQVDLEIIPGE